MIVMNILTKKQAPDLFTSSRPEFTIAMVCDCGWITIAMTKDDAQAAGEVHRSHFCSHRCS